jgi:two-component system chemotaxis response regulator CheY
MPIDFNMKILVADDNELMRETVRNALKDSGFVNVTEVSDGVQALSHLKKGKFDLLVTDWNMPNMDGITLVRMVRGDTELHDLKVIIVTADAEKGHVVEAIKVGISDYIVKPFTGEVLQKKIEKIFGISPSGTKIQ